MTIPNFSVTIFEIFLNDGVFLLSKNFLKIRILVEILSDSYQVKLLNPTKSVSFVVLFIIKGSIPVEVTFLLD